MFTNKKTGKFFKVGDLMKREDLAKTFEKIANSDDPVALFYRGELTDIFVEELNNTLTHQDFKDYKANKNDAIVFELGEDRLLAPTLPSSGVILGFIMKVVDEVSVTSL